jgi:hypothetical protein
MVNADKIFDPAIRTAFLKNLPAHRELMQLWQDFKGKE